MRHLVFLAGLLAVCLVAADTARAEISGAWTYMRYTQEVDGGDYGSDPDHEIGGLLIFTSDASAPGIMFICSVEKGLAAFVSTRGVDFAESVDRFDRGTNRRDVTVTLGEGEPDTRLWNQMPRAGVIDPDSKAMSARLYNAVIQGKPVTVKMTGRSPVIITFPPVDDLFETWARSCPATSPQGRPV